MEDKQAKKGNKSEDIDLTYFLNLAKNPKVQWAFTIILLLVVIFLSSSIRLSNWDLLNDKTTGEKIPIALDPFYFLRHSETILENGSLGEVDPMRYPSAKVGYSTEIMPQVVVWMYKISNVFGDYTLREVNVASPVIFFMMGLVLFFLLVYGLTKSKSMALIASTFLAFVPSYLYRTLAGFSDHEAIGMVAFFGAMLVYLLGLKYVSEKDNLKYVIGLGILSGFMTALTIVSWGGVARFLFIIFPLSFTIIWFSKVGENKLKFLERGLLFYGAWLISAPLCAIFFRNTILGVIKGYLLSTNGLISLAIFGFILVDYYLIKNLEKFKFIKKEYREFYSLAGLGVLGVVGLTILGKNIFSIINELWTTIFHPWGVGRIGLTIAENAQPYLVDWIGQSGVALFWMFFLGIIILGIEIAKGFEKKKSFLLFLTGWIILISSILFSRISPTSLLQGTNLFSQIIYIGGVAISMIIFVKVYLEDKPKIRPEMAIITAWILFTLISGRAAQRIFFAIAPVVAFMASFAIVNLWNSFKKSKDEILKPIIGILLILVIFGGAYSVYNSEKIISAQAAVTGPSANYQWQGAMAWLRENTTEDSVLVHWWDYGHWVTGLGKRIAVTDGGHAIGYWDHLIGRYLLTTPNPETAYSFMKSHEVDYLLIDPSDIGKYPAYSIIGSDELGKDRYSSIPPFVLSPSQTRENVNGTIYVYTGGVYVDEDIRYSLGNNTIFLPADKAVLVGIIWEKINKEGKESYNQPIAVFSYNNKQHNIPLRYIYIRGELIDYGSGLESIVRIVPLFDGNNLNPQGSMMYLSPKVKDGLFAQIYLLGDTFGNYESIKIAHSEEDDLVSYIKSQGLDLGDFVYYGGFRGPLNIYEVDYPENIQAREEFLRIDGEYAEFDNLTFVK